MNRRILMDDEFFTVHQDDDESFDASDDGEPHVTADDEAILYADKLQQLADAGF